MAILSCEECGGRISTLAHACPHCGAPVQVGANLPRAPASLPPSSPATSTAIHPARRAQPTRTGDYVVDHWAGAHPLWVSYWITGVLGGIVVGLFAGWAGQYIESRRDLAVLMLPLTAFCVFQIVGVWRSASFYSTTPVRRLVAGAAKAWCVLGVLGVGLGALFTIALLTRGGDLVATGAGPGSARSPAAKAVEATGGGAGPAVKPVVSSLEQWRRDQAVEDATWVVPQGAATAQATEDHVEHPPAPTPAPSTGCIYKPVMTNAEIAACREPESNTPR